MREIASVFAIHSVIVVQFCLGAEFRNLGFDDADRALPPGSADPATVLPGWSLYLGDERAAIAYVNPPEFVLSGDSVALGNGSGFAWYEGKFAIVFGRKDPGSPVWTLEQTGTIPATAKYLTYRSWYYGMEVQIDKEVIPPLDWQLPSQPGLSNLVYDVSKFAGKEVKLGLVGPFGPYGWPGFRAVSCIDSIVFLADVPTITADVRTPPGATTNEVTLRFAAIPGRNMIVEFRDDLRKEGKWQALPGAPHNSGTATDASAGLPRFYRLRVDVPRVP